MFARRQKRHADQDRNQGDYVFHHNIFSSRGTDSLVVLNQMNRWKCVCLVCMDNGIM